MPVKTVSKQYIFQKNQYQISTFFKTGLSAMKRWHENWEKIYGELEIYPDRLPC